MIERFFRKVKNYFNGIRCPNCNSTDCVKHSHFAVKDGSLVYSSSAPILEIFFTCFNCEGKFVIKYGVKND